MRNTLCCGYQDWIDTAAVRIEDAIAEKAEAMEKIDAVLDKEWAAYEALAELLDNDPLNG